MFQLGADNSRKKKCGQQSVGCQEAVDYSVPVACGNVYTGQTSQYINDRFTKNKGNFRQSLQVIAGKAFFLLYWLLRLRAYVEWNEGFGERKRRLQVADFENSPYFFHAWQLSAKLSSCLQQVQSCFGIEYHVSSLSELFLLCFFLPFLGPHICSFVSE